MPNVIDYILPVALHGEYMVPTCPPLLSLSFVPVSSISCLAYFPVLFPSLSLSFSVFLPLSWVVFISLSLENCFGFSSLLQLYSRVAFPIQETTDRIGNRVFSGGFFGG